MRSSSVGGGPKKVAWINRSEYRTLKALAKVARAGSSMFRPCVWALATASARNISLDRKPFNRGTPAIAAAATIARVAVKGMKRKRPLSLRISRVPASWSMMPAAMKSDALKVAWFTVWKMAAIQANGLPNPSSSTIRPRWLIVE